MNVDELLEQARASLHRVTPADAARATASGALLVDIRPIEQRARDGEIAGALIVDRNVLEWRLDPQSADRIPEIGSYESNPGNDVVFVRASIVPSVTPRSTL